LYSILVPDSQYTSLVLASNPNFIPDLGVKFVNHAADKTKLFVLSNIVQKMLCALQLWYVSQPSPTLSTWYSITPDDFKAFRITYSTRRLMSSVASPVAAVPVAASPPPSNFRSAIKINLNDYVKFKENSEWRSFNRHLRATAASHDTMDILDPAFTPPPSDATVFEQKRFMYNVFSQCILTSKGKVCVRAHEKDLDAQQVYKDLLAIYADQLTMQLDATNIRSELTTMKLDDKWRKSYVTFLNLWCSRAQELESIEDKAVDDDTKRIWLTNTLQSHKEMNNAIRQAINP
jgi:hypothetical protein